MARVGMTWPHYLAGVCRIDGRLTRLTLRESDVLLALLLHSPRKWAKARDVVNTVWDNPDSEPTDASGVFRTMIGLLRRRGVQIDALQGWGYRIPEEARGLHTAVKSAE